MCGCVTTGRDYMWSNGEVTHALPEVAPVLKTLDMIRLNITFKIHPVQYDIKHMLNSLGLNLTGVKVNFFSIGCAVAGSTFWIGIVPYIF